MKNQKLGALLAAVMVSTMVAVPACAETGGNVHSSEVVASAEIMPRDKPVADGTINDPSGYEFEDDLDRDDGKYVNFYVENLGNNPIVASIYIDGSDDPSEERTFQPGETGHIFVEVTQGFLGFNKDYKFTLVPGANGGTVYASSIIYQRDQQS